MRTRTTSTISGGPSSQLVPFELEEFQHSHWSVTLEKSDTLDKSPSYGFLWTGGMDAGSQTLWAGSQHAAKGWEADLEWEQEVGGGNGGWNVSLPFLSHLKHCVPRSPKETIYRQLFLIFYRECSTQRLSDIASKTQGLMSGEAEKDTTRQV